MYKYFSTQRPIVPGSYPKRIEPIFIVNFDDKKVMDGVECWGYLVYGEPLTEKERSGFELTKW